MTEPYCPDCGSTEITIDASATWDNEKQDWVLAGTQDNATCENCGYSSKHWNSWRPISTTKPGKKTHAT